MKEQLQDLKEIRQMMERSTKFLSLSGLSGISAGVIALIASFIAWQMQPERVSEVVYDGLQYKTLLHAEYIWSLVYLGLATVVLALAAGFFFTWRKAKKKQSPMWNKTSKRLLVSLCIPMIAGAFVIVSLLINEVYWIIPELTLIFYGLTLVNAAQHTYRDVFYLGMTELVVGIIALFVSGYSLLFWAFGFGVLHIIYGISMHLKYERD
ncbi:MAG: membrane-associated HD superfamily phosphohydrolase [Spirosomataceae bacterium]|jgi:membrane-associated HD superfamily phosphohydrolase